ncbi:MAG: LLM class flavin-dependent oxidoreductase [Rhodospirillales bacterium]
MLKLSVLDQSPIPSGGTAADAIRHTIDLAQATEKLGYTRYWVAEHHGSSAFAGCAPEIMLTRIAEATSTIRVGSGGVMLSHYSPYKVAEMFRLLEVMYPGRIDLGIGRAPGSDGVTAQALGYGSPVGVEYYPARVADLSAFMAGSSPPTEAFADVKALPETEHIPEIWVLGSSNQSAGCAAHFGLPFSFAHFIMPRGGVNVVKAYKDAFKPSELFDAPRDSVAVFVICAETEKEASRLEASRDLFRLRASRGEFIPYPTPEEALAYEYSAGELAQVEANRERNIVGTPRQVKMRIEELADQYDTEEIVVLSICHDHNDRVRSYELVAEAFNLQAN